MVVCILKPLPPFFRWRTHEIHEHSQCASIEKKWNIFRFQTFLFQFYSLYSSFDDCQFIPTCWYVDSDIRSLNYVAIVSLKCFGIVLTIQRIVLRSTQTCICRSYRRRYIMIIIIMIKTQINSMLYLDIEINSNPYRTYCTWQMKTLLQMPLMHVLIAGTHTTPKPSTNIFPSTSRMWQGRCEG